MPRQRQSLKKGHHKLGKDCRNREGQKLESESSDEFKNCVTGCYCAQLLLDTKPLTVELSGQAGYHGGMSTVGLFSVRSPTPLHHKLTRLK